MSRLRMITCNVRGLADKSKRGQIFNYLRDKEIDVAFLQEVHSQKTKSKQWRNEYGFNIIFAHGTGSARGVAIAFGRGLDYECESIIRDEEGRYIICRIKIDNMKLLLCNCYAPNEASHSFFEQLLEKLRLNSEKIDHVIWGGDLNVHLTQHDTKDKFISTASTELINNFLEENSWIDIWRYVNGEKFSFTWRQVKKRLFTRIDYFIVPQGTLDLVSDCEIWPGVLTDHSFVFLELK